jgi:PRTRC genetic system ThiF family protein
MISDKTKAHFTDNYLIDPTNPIKINLIGAGGTGSKVLTALVEMNLSLIALGHAGLSVRLWDDDQVSEANLGRQRFASSEVGLNKAVALINRANRWAGTNWKAQTERFELNSNGEVPEHTDASIYITCVDTIKARFEVADILTKVSNKLGRRGARYWMDFGNSQHSGQVVLATVGDIKQPSSNLYEPVANLPFVTEEFGDLLRSSEADDDTPSCSLAEALEKQDLYINSALAQMGSNLLWGLFRNGFTEYRGFFLNLKEFRSQPLKVA